MPMRLALCYLAWTMLVLCSSLCNAEGQCLSRTQVERVNKQAYEQLQDFVNEGHEPWRLDSQAVAASQVFALEGTPKARWDLYSLPLTTVQETKMQAVYEYESRSRHGVSYRIKLRHFDWLLPLARKWEWMVWAPVAVVITDCSQAR
jgi:hypothetical protein